MDMTKKKKVMKNCKILAIIFIGILLVSSPVLCNWWKEGFNYYGGDSRIHYQVYPKLNILMNEDNEMNSTVITICDITKGNLIKTINVDYRVTDYEISNDKKLFVTAANPYQSYDTTFTNLNIVDFETGVKVFSIRDGYYADILPYISDFHFSPHNKYLFYLKDDDIRIFDLTTFQNYLSIDYRDHIRYFQEDKIGKVIFSSDEKYLTLYNGDSSRIWNLEEKKEILSFRKGVYLGFTEDSKNIIIQRDSIIEIKALETNQNLKKFILPRKPKYVFLKNSSIFCIRYKNEIELRDFNFKQICNLFYDDERDYFYISEDAKYIGMINDITWDNSNTKVNYNLDIYDVIAGEYNKRFPYGYIHLEQKGPSFRYNRQIPYDAIFLNDEEVLLLYSNDIIYFCSGEYDWSGYNWNEVWNFRTGKMIRKIPQSHNGNIIDIKYSPDSRIVASASKDSTIMIWNANDGKFYQKIDDLSQSISISPDLLYLASYGEDNIPRIYEITSGKVYRQFPKQESGLSYFNFSPDGKKLIIADTNYNILVFDVIGNGLNQVYKSLSKTLSSIYFERNDSWIGIGDGIEWNILSGTEIKKIHVSVYNYFFSNDGKFVAEIEPDRLQILDVQLDSIVKTIEFGQDMHFYNAIFTHDNRNIILSESNSNYYNLKINIYILDLSIGFISRIFSIPLCQISNLIISPNDKQIAFTNEKADLIVIDLPTITEVEPINITENKLILYPNPASDFINLRFNLAKSTNISIKIYDILGNPVAELANEWCVEGWQNKQIDILGLQSGTYYCRLSYENEVQILNMMLIK
jgi:WD40 repeat protein